MHLAKHAKSSNTYIVNEIGVIPYNRSYFWIGRVLFEKNGSHIYFIYHLDSHISLPFASECIHFSLAGNYENDSNIKVFICTKNIILNQNCDF